MIMILVKKKHTAEYTSIVAQAKMPPMQAKDRY